MKFILILSSKISFKYIIICIIIIRINNVIINNCKNFNKNKTMSAPKPKRLVYAYNPKGNDNTNEKKAVYPHWEHIVIK